MTSCPRSVAGDEVAEQKITSCDASIMTTVMASVGARVRVWVRGGFMLRAEQVAEPRSRYWLGLGLGLEDFV